MTKTKQKSLHLRERAHVVDFRFPRRLSVVTSTGLQKRIMTQDATSQIFSSFQEYINEEQEIREA